MEIIGKINTMYIPHPIIRNRYHLFPIDVNTTTNSKKSIMPSHIIQENAAVKKNWRTAATIAQPTCRDKNKTVTFVTNTFKITAQFVYIL